MDKGMSEIQLSRVLSGLSFGITVYIAFVIAPNMAKVYSNYLSWSDGNALQAAIFTALVCSALISSMLITYFIRIGKRNWFLIFLAAHVWLAITSWVSYLLVLIVFGWWFSKYAFQST